LRYGACVHEQAAKSTSRGKDYNSEVLWSYQKHP
jgi:hypothetical protein